MQNVSVARQVVRYLLLISFIGALLGCAFAVKTPMDVLVYENHNDAHVQRNLFVFLRGVGGSHRSFEKEGLVADVWARGMPFDMVAPNAHFGYYGDPNLFVRLKADVIDPALAKGYQEIWLVGFSLGGLGALLYLMDEPADVRGVFLISPFLGGRSFLKEIIAVGGVRQWDPGEYVVEEDWERMLWHWLKREVADNPEKKVFLGFGVNDRYKTGQQLLATILPAERVNIIHGKHDYRTFKKLWAEFLDAQP